MKIVAAVLFAWSVALTPVGVRADEGPAPVVIDVAIEANKVVGARTVRARQGDRVELRFASDARHDLHLHGYDIEQTVAPGAAAAMAFTARAAGRFPVTTHAGSGGHGHAALLYLEILPR